MFQNGQAHFKNLAAKCCKILKVCLTILGHYALKVSFFFWQKRPILMMNLHLLKTILIHVVITKLFYDKTVIFFSLICYSYITFNPLFLRSVLRKKAKKKQSLRWKMGMIFGFSSMENVIISLNHLLHHFKFFSVYLCCPCMLFTLCFYSMIFLINP